jgi:hypothetical protein
VELVLNRPSDRRRSPKIAVLYFKVCPYAFVQYGILITACRQPLPTMAGSIRPWLNIVVAYRRLWLSIQYCVYTET